VVFGELGGDSALVLLYTQYGSFVQCISDAEVLMNIVEYIMGTWNLVLMTIMCRMESQTWIKDTNRY
jgi:hypothetical protein